MARKHGKRGQILWDTTPTGSPITLVALGDLNAWTLDMSTDRVEVTAFGDTNKQRVTGLPDFSGTMGGFWNPTSAPTYFGAVLAGTPVQQRLVPDTSDTGYFEGLANVDGSVNVSATGAITIAGRWDAAGNWTFASTTP